MPVVRVDVREGHPRAKLLALRGQLESAVARTWAKDHIYVSVNQFPADDADRTVIMTVDLRPGRGQEKERSAALYRESLKALEELVDADPQRFVLLVREFPERSFVVDGGMSLPPLSDITPSLS